jgi:cysteinyl-tRNA synthetase
MPFSLYDPHADAIVPFTAEEPPALRLAATTGPEGLAELRQQVLEDVLTRQLTFHANEPGGALKAALVRFTADALHDAYAPESLRYFLTSVHYREPLALVPGDAADPVAESERQLAYIYATRRRLLELPRDRIVPVQTQPADMLAGFSDALSRALDHDLDTPRALAEAHTFLIAVNALCDSVMRKGGRANASAVDSARAGVSSLLGSLGIGAEDPQGFLVRLRNRRAQARGIDVAAVDARVAQRADARAARDFSAADRIQDALIAQGVRLLDGLENNTWTLD